MNLKEFIIVLLVYFAITCVVTWPLILNMGSMIYGSFGDPVIGITTLQVMKANEFHLTGDISNPGFGAPFGETVAYSGFIPYFVLVLYPIALVSSPIVAYNLIPLMGLFLAAVGMYLFSRRYLKSRFCSFVAGFIFSFYPLHLYNATATFTKSQTYVIPLFIFALLLFDRKKSYRNALIFAVAAALTAFFSYYHFFFALIFVAIFYFYKFSKDLKGIAKNFASNLQYHMAFLAAFSLLFGVFVLPFFMVAIEDMEQSRVEGIIGAKRTNIMSMVFSSAWPHYYFLPHVYNPLLGPFTLPFVSETKVGTGFGSTALYLGFTVLALAGYALWRKRNSPIVGFMLFSAIALFVFATGPFMRYIPILGIPIAAAPLAVAIYFAYKGNRKLVLYCVSITVALTLVPLLYGLIPVALNVGEVFTGISFSEFSTEEVVEHLNKYDMFPIPMPSIVSFNLLPFFRAYVNLSLWMVFFIALLAAIGLEKLSEGIKSKRARYALFAVVFVLLFAEYINVPPFRTTDLSVIPPEYVWLAGVEGKPIVAEYPIGFDYSFYLYYQLVHGKPVLNGHFNAESVELQKQVVNLNDVETVGLLRQAGVRYVIVHDETLYNRVPKNFVENVTMKQWYLNSKSWAYTKEFLENNGVAGLVKVKEFPHAIVYEVIRNE